MEYAPVDAHASHYMELDLRFRAIIFSPSSSGQNSGMDYKHYYKDKNILYLPYKNQFSIGSYISFL